MRVLFFGTTEFALPSLYALADAGVLAGVVTQPDRPAGRGHRLTSSPVKMAAATLGPPVHEPADLAVLMHEIAAEKPFDFFALASYGKILPTALLAQPRFGALNVHPSLLPAYRGATPIQTALRDGATQTGVSLMLMDAGMDTGEIVLAQPVAIQPDETYGVLHDRLAILGAEMLARAMRIAQAGPLPHTPQSGAVSVTKPIRKGDLVLDWQWPAERIVDHVRAYAPKPSAHARLAGENVKVMRASVDSARSRGLPGSLLGISGDGVLVSCGIGAVVVEELIAPNRAREFGAQFYRRLQVAPLS